ncbi:MAG TPA: hypothetical protein VG013_31320 [Gemmataceae bacterium]|jgi:hypothetical protein|nr:hypothetical protein [Gemmataceae bacterium]
MTPLRQEILHVLAELSRLDSGAPLGQLVVNLAYWAEGTTGEAIWTVSDEELLAAARKHLESRLKAHGEPGR